MDYDGLDTLYIYSCIFSLLAFLLTFFGLELHIAYESNKIMAFLITNYGWVGAFWVKIFFMFVCFLYYKGLIFLNAKLKLKYQKIEYTPFFVVLICFLFSLFDFINNIYVIFM